MKTKKGIKNSKRYVAPIDPYEGVKKDESYFLPVNTRGGFTPYVAELDVVYVYDKEQNKQVRKYVRGDTTMNIGGNAMELAFTDFIGDKLQLNKKILETNKELHKYSNPIRMLLYKKSRRMNEYNEELSALFRGHLNQILKTGITMEEAKKKAMKRIEKDIDRISKAIDEEFPPKELKKFAKRRDEYNKMVGWDIDGNEIDVLLKNRFDNL